MTIEVIFLGTGCMQPTKVRNQAGVLLKYKSEHLLFDCGEGIQRQMRIAGVKPAKVSRLLSVTGMGIMCLEFPDC